MTGSQRQLGNQPYCFITTVMGTTLIASVGSSPTNLSPGCTSYQHHIGAQTSNTLAVRDQSTSKP